MTIKKLRECHEASLNKTGDTFTQWISMSRAANKIDLQLLNYALVKLKCSNPDDLSQLIVSFKATEFSLNTRKFSCDYMSIRKAVLNINKLISTNNIDFIVSCSYNHLSKQCEFFFTEKAFFFLEAKHQRLVSNRRLKESLSLKTGMAIRLYNYHTKWRYVKKTSFIPIQELKENLGIPDGSYLRFERFRSCILDKCVSEINYYTSQNLTYELKTQGLGGKVCAIRFYFDKKTI